VNGEIKIFLNLGIELLYTPNTNSIEVTQVIPVTHTQSLQSDVSVAMTHKLNVSEIRYGILTLGSKSQIGALLQESHPITIVYKGQEFTGITHSSILGRVDRLKSMINFDRNVFYVGNEIELVYFPGENKLKITERRNEND
jgi:hypothetical protein